MSENMNRIELLSDIKGKAVKSVYSYDCHVAIVFADETYIVLTAENDGEDGATLEIDAHLWPAVMVRLGVMSQAEFDAIKAADNEKWAARERENELAKLAELKAKYPEAAQ